VPAGWTRYTPVEVAVTRYLLREMHVDLICQNSNPLPTSQVKHQLETLKANLMVARSWYPPKTFRTALMRLACAKCLPLVSTPVLAEPAAAF
jgi:hypothetical protein